MELNVNSAAFVAIYVHFQFAGLAINMRGKTKISLTLTAKPKTSDKG